MASVPPEVNVPPAPGPNPARSHIQRTTRASRIVPTGDISQTAADWLSAATSDSVQTAAGSGRRDLVAHRARVAEVVGVGDHVPPQALEHVLDRPARCGSGSSNRRASSSGSAEVDTRPSPVRVAAK